MGTLHWMKNSHSISLTSFLRPRLKTRTLHNVFYNKIWPITIKSDHQRTQIVFKLKTNLNPDTTQSSSVNLPILPLYAIHPIVEWQKGKP